MSVKQSVLPAVGKKTPDFALMSDRGEKVKLSALRGAPVVLYFYPKDDTPGCTVEALEFRDAAEDFAKLGAKVIGISTDSVESHCKFIQKHDLNFTLLADPDHKACERYGVWVEKMLYGRKFWGVQRATFLIDADGKVARVWPKVTPKGHAADVLAELKALESR